MHSEIEKHSWDGVWSHQVNFPQVRATAEPVRTSVRRKVTKCDFEKEGTEFELVR